MLRLSSCALAAASIALLACGGEPPAAPDPDPACLEPDRECSAAPPFDGAPCEGTLECTWPEAMARCEAGRWAVTQLCEGCAPPLAEVCDAPFAGALEGASIAIGPADLGSFCAFAEGERVAPVWGAQGLAMVGYRLDVSAPEGVEVPACVHTRVSVSLDGGMAEIYERDLVLRCGRSLGALDILPELPCAFRDYALELRVEIAGAGEVSTSLVVEGGGCPRELPG